MNRSVMKIGSTTLVVSLPLPWAKRFGIKKGDELKVEEQGRVLRVSTEKAMREKEITIDSSIYNPIIHRVLGVLYKTGYSKMRILYSPKEEMILRTRRMKESDVILRTTDHFTGMDLIEAGEDHILIEEKAEIDYKEFANTTDQLFRSVVKQSEQVYEAIKERRYDIATEVDIKERIINQTSDFCLKVLNTKGYEEYKKTNFMYEIIDGLEAIGDQYGRIYYNFIKDEKKVMGREQLKTFAWINESLNGFFSLYKNFNPKKIAPFMRENLGMLEYFDESFDKIKKEEIRNAIHMYAIAQKMNELIEPLIALNHDKLGIKR